MIAVALIVFAYPPPVAVDIRTPAPMVSGSTQVDAASSGLDLTRLLSAIRAVEGWRGRRGPAGEFGPYQILPSVWRRHSRVSPWFASQAEHRRVALAQISDIRRALELDGRDHHSPFWVALAWNAGADAVIRGTAPQRSWDYADRARNIYCTQP